MTNKLIGVSGSWITDSDGMFPGYHRSYVNDDYIDSVVQAGGVPVIIPVTTDLAVIRAQVAHLDGLILSGGQDVNPLEYGEQPRQKCGPTFPDRDRFELQLIKEAEQRHLPILGICRGAQLLNVYHGGTIIQDLSYADHELIRHSQPDQPTLPTHSVRVSADSPFASIFDQNKFTVNSFHHQVIGELGADLQVGITAPDGVVEGFSNFAYDGFEVAVQFHPEMLHRTHPQAQQLFKAFMENA